MVEVLNNVKSADEPIKADAMGDEQHIPAFVDAKHNTEMVRNNSSLSGALEATYVNIDNVKYIDGSQRRFDSSKKDMLQREVASIATLVEETSDELTGIVTQWQCMVDLISARLMAWKASTNSRLQTLSERVQDVEHEVDAFSNDLDADASTLHAMHAALADQRSAFAAHMHAAKQEFEATRALATSINNATSGRVKLNIGGWRCEVAMDTLCRYKGSFFARLLEGSFTLARDEEGYVFLDRDGAPYVYVINWLRDGPSRAVLPDGDAVMMQRLAVEADFLGLDELALQVMTSVRAKQQPAAETVMKKTVAVKRGKGSSSPSRWARGLARH